MADKQLQAAFTRYWQERVRQAGALTPMQTKALIAELRRELQEEGRVPLLSGPVRLPPQHPLVQAAVAGRPVSIGGGRVIERRATSAGERMQALPLPAKLATMLAVLLLPCLLAGAVVALGSQDGAAPVVAVAPTAEPSATPSPTPTATPTAEPTLTPTLVAVTSTPYALALTTGPAAPAGNDPASVELAGYSFILSAGQVRDGIWQPLGAEWLAGTELRRVVAIPYAPDIANAVVALRPGNVIKLRLRSGEIVRYRVSEVARAKRHEIEVLAARSPSLAVLLHGEPSGERWVVVADAVQELPDLTIYTAGPSGSVPAEAFVPPTLAVTSTLIPTSVQTVYTDSQTILHEAAGLTLTVGTCDQVERIGEAEPNANDQRFLVCSLSLQAVGDTPAPYSAQAFGIAEREEVDTSTDWFPAPVRIGNGLGEGTLNPGATVTGRVAGTVQKASVLGRSGDPVLVWEQAGIRYVIQLQP